MFLFLDWYFDPYYSNSSVLCWKLWSLNRTRKKTKMWVLHGLHFSFTKLLKIFFAFFLVWKTLLFGGPVKKMDWPGPGGLKVSYWTQWTSRITARTDEIVPRYWSEETATGSPNAVSRLLSSNYIHHLVEWVIIGISVICRVSFLFSLIMLKSSSCFLS